MLLKKNKVLLLVLFVGIIISNVKIFGNRLGDHEKTRLYDSMKPRNGDSLTIDVSYTKKVITETAAAKKIGEARMEKTKKLRKKLGRDSITLGSDAITLADGSNVHLSEIRTRIGIGGKLRHDAKVFGDKERTEVSFEATTINTGVGDNDHSYLIDHKLKQVSIWPSRRWLGYDVLRLGQVDQAILVDIVRLYSPKWRVRASKKKALLHKGKGAVDKKVVDEIECIDLEGGKPKYRISLDPNDWKICRKIAWYDDKSGLVSKIEENKEFAKAKGNGNLFPRLIVRQYFDSEGKKEKTEFINITNVVIGLPVSEDIFKLDAPPEYSVIDDR